jgi:ArsR family transcriptional regulator, arsenate/arsenite/antimonite-responsive transcriptional repressor / arsenate reductase (thioredoxin)
MLAVVQHAVLTRSGDGDPPQVLRLVGHPIRWQLLQELVRSDRAVAELTELLGAPQSLVSYHLRELRSGELVAMRRSSADRRDCYYRIDLDRCRDLLRAAGAALHPGLGRGSPVARWSGRDARRRRRVLFLCTGNSARSQIAEALLEHRSEGAVEAASAGSNPKPLHPNAVRVMKRRGIDISANRTKHLDEFVGERFDVVVTLCDRVREVCPVFPGHPDLVHWSIPDPAIEGSTSRATYPAFERTASELETRVRSFLYAITEPSTRRSTHARR